MIKLELIPGRILSLVSCCSLLSPQFDILAPLHILYRCFCCCCACPAPLTPQSYPPPAVVVVLLPRLSGLTLKPQQWTEGHVRLDLRLFLLPWKLHERERARERERRDGTPTQPAAAGGWRVVLHIDCAVTHRCRPHALKNARTGRDLRYISGTDIISSAKI